MKKQLAIALLFTSLIACSGATTASPTFSPEIVAELDGLLDDTLTTLDVPGVCTILDVEGVGRYERCRGVAELGASDPMAMDLQVRIGSITKTMTVTMLLKLMEQGVVSLDDPISKYVEGSPKPNATLLQLANMTAGLASYTYDPAFQNVVFTQTDKTWTPEEVLAIGAQNTTDGCPHAPELCFEAGAGWSYSNTNIVLLGLVIEKVTGKSYAENLQELVTGPLGLTKTYRPDRGKLREPFAHGYTFQGSPDGSRRDATHWNSTWGFGTGDIVSTPRELAIYAQALGSGRLLKEETNALRFTKVTLPPNQPDHAYAVGIGYLYGWWGHQGSLPGFNAYALYRPDAKATLAIVVNHDGVKVDGKDVSPAEYVANRIIDIGAREAPLGDLVDNDIITDDPSL